MDGAESCQVTAERSRQRLWYELSVKSAMDSDSKEDETRIVRSTVSEYSREAGIHGIKYVVESVRTNFERLVGLLVGWPISAFLNLEISCMVGLFHVRLTSGANQKLC